MVMNEKPRHKKESFFANKLAGKIAYEGVIIGLCTLAAYAIGHFVTKNDVIAQTMAFFTLSSTQLFHAYNVKTNYSVFDKKNYKNSFMNFAFIVGFALQFLVIYTPGLNGIFKLQGLSIAQLGICLGLSLVMVVIYEIIKLVNRIKNK